MEQRLKTRKEVVTTGVKMLGSGLVVGTWGNISTRVPDEDLVAITPSGMNYDELVAEDIVLVDLEGNVVDGLRKPSIEVPMHVAIYQNRPDIQAIVHTHSAFATAMAAARKPIPGAVEDLVQIVGGDVRVCEYALPGSKELGQNVIKALERRQAVLLANHGMLGAGRNLNEALKICQVVEKAAQITIFAKVLGGVVELSQEDVDFMRDFYLNAYGQR